MSTTVLERPDESVGAPAAPHFRAVEIMLAAEAGALAVVVGVSGSPAWQLVRVAGTVAIAAAGLIALRRSGRSASGLIAAVGGVVGTVAGAGIGVMHFAKGDASVAASAALIAFLTGLGLLISGSYSLVRALHGRRRILALPVAYLVFQFGLVPLTVAVYGTNAPRTNVGRATPADRGLAYRDVSFVTADRVRLSGWYIPSHNGAAVVLLHGSGETRSAVLDHAVVLARAGYGVLLVDARGHGRSGGNANEFGWYGNRDVTAAVTYVSRQPDVRAGRIAAIGESMGGEEAIGAAATDARIRAVVAEGALWRVPADTAWLAHDGPGLITRGMNWIQAQATKVLSGAPEPIGLRDAVIATAPRPVLLIAGRDEIAGDRSYRDASPANVRLWELRDTAHTKGLQTHPAEWRANVITFLDRALFSARNNQGA